MGSVRSIDIVAIFQVVMKHKATTETICQRTSAPSTVSAADDDAESTGLCNGELESPVRSLGAGPFLRDQRTTTAATLIVGSLALLGLFSNTAWSAVQTCYGSDTYGHGFPIIANGSSAFGIVMTANLTDRFIFTGPITHTSAKAPKSPAHLTDSPIGRHGREPVGVEEV